MKPGDIVRDTGWFQWLVVSVPMPPTATWAGIVLVDYARDETARYAPGTVRMLYPGCSAKVMSEDRIPPLVWAALAKWRLTT